MVGVCRGNSGVVQGMDSRNFRKHKWDNAIPRDDAYQERMQDLPFGLQ